MKKYLFLLLIGASYLKSYGGTHYAPIVSNDGSPIKKETIISFVFGRKISQPIKIYVNREVYKNSLENQLSVRKLAYPQYYNADMTLEQWLNKLEWVSGSKFNQQWYKNTGVNKTTGAIEILNSLYPDWGSLPATLKGGNSIGYWAYVSGTFVDPVIKDNCGNIILSNIPITPVLDEKEEQPQKEYANLPCRMGRIEMGQYDTENGVTYGRLSADGRYHYLKRDGSWSELINGEWVKIICPEQQETVVERKTVYKKTIIDTVFVKEYVQNTQTLYTFQNPTCNHHNNCHSGCNQNQNQNVYYEERSTNWGFRADFFADEPREERIVYRDREEPRYRREEQPILWDKSHSFDSGNELLNNDWSNSYSMDSGNELLNNHRNNNYTNNNNNNHAFDRSGYIARVNERVGR